MSSIDNRIVQMQFENSQFEKGVKQSLKSIEELEKSLEFKDAEKSLSSLQKAGDSFSLASMANGIEKVSEKFSALSIIGKRVLENLTDTAMRMGESFVKSISVDQITAGFSKYETKTRSTKTIMEATGKDVDYVNERLEKLNRFTDETSYNFSDMVENIGKFTSMGIDLDTSVTAMEGIATWAALSGQGVAEASRAMYNLSQAIGVGSVKLMDWKSIENANMATKEFKQTVIEIAKSMGKLNAKSKTAKGTLVNFENFSQTLSEGWFTKDVLLKALDEYGSAANKIIEYMDTHEIYSVSKAIEQMGLDLNDLGVRAFLAAQESRTFKDSIDATKDAVSTGWMKTFEYVFGNVDQATKLWTEFTEVLYEVFAAGAETRNSILKEWSSSEVGGREDLVRGFMDVLWGLVAVLNSVKEAFKDIFLPGTEEDFVGFLKTASTTIKEFGASFRAAVEPIEILTGEFEELERVIPANPFEPFEKSLQRGARSDEVKKLQERLMELEYDLPNFGADGIFGPETKAALEAFQRDAGLTVDGIYDEATHKALGKAMGFSDKDVTVIDTVEKKIEQLPPQAQKYKNILMGVFSSFHIVGQILGTAFKIVTHFISLLSPFGDVLLAIGSAIGQSITAFDKWLKEAGVFDKWFEDAKKFLEPFGEWVKKAADSLLSFFGLSGETNGEIFAFTKLYNNVKNSIKKTGIIDKLTKAWEGFKNTFKNLGTTLKKNWKTVKETLGERFQGFLASLPDKIASVTEWLGNLASDGLNFISSIVQKIPSAIEKIKGFWAALTQKGDSDKNQAPGFLTRVKDAFTSVIDFLFGEGDIANGKKPGLFRKIGQLISGDLDGFTEGMDDNTKKQVLDRIQGIKDFLQKIREAIVVLFGGQLADDKKISDETVQKIEQFKSSIASVFEGIALLFTGKVQENSKLSKDAQDKIIGIRNTIEGIIKLIGSTLTSLWNTIVGIFTGEVTFDSVGEFFSSFWESIKQFFSEASGIASTNLGTAWENIKKFFSDLWENVKSIGKWLLIGFAVYKAGKALGSITGAFNKLKEVIASYKKNTQALSKTVLEFAAAIALIAGSIWLVGQLSDEQFIKGAAAVGGIVVAIAILLGVCALFKGGKEATKAVKNLGEAVFQLGLGIAIIAGTIVALGALVPWDTLIKGMLKLGAVMVLMLAFMWGLKKFGATSIKLKGFYQIAIVLAAMSYIAVKLGKVPMDQMLKGILALLAISGILAGFMYVIGKIGNGKIKTKGLIGISVAVGILAFIAVKLGKMKDQGELWRGIGAVAAIMAMIAGMAFIMGKWGKDMKIGSMLVLFVGIIAIMIVFEEIIQRIKDVDPSILWAFSGSLALALGAFVAACLIVGKIKNGPASMLKGAASIGGALALFATIIGGLVYGLGELDKLANGGIVESIERGGAVLTALANVLSPFIDSFEEAIAVVGLLVASEVVGQIPGGPGAMIKGSLAISGALDILVISVGIFTYGLGSLDSISDLDLIGKIQKGGEVLSAISKAVGSFTDSYDDFAVIAGFLASSEIVGLIPGGPLAMITGAAGISGALSLLVVAATALVTGLGALNQVTDNGLVEAIKSGGEVLSSLGSAIYGLIGGFNQAFQNDIKGFGDAVSSVAKDVKGMSEDGSLDADLEVALGVAEKIHGFFSDLEAYTINTAGFEGYITAASELSTDMGKFSQAIEDFRTGVGGISTEETIDADTTKAINVAKKIKEDFFDVIADQTPSGDGLVSYNDAVNSVVGNVQSFATAMGTFHTNISGFDSPGIENDTSAAIKAATAVANFLSDLHTQADRIENDKTAFAAFLTGDTVQGTVFNAIEALSTNIKESRLNLQGLGTGTYAKDLGAAITAIDQLATMLSKFKDQNIAYGYSQDNVDALLGWLEDIGGKIITISDKFKENKVDTTSIGLALHSVSNLANVLSGQGVNKISTENFLSGLDLESITTKLSEFSGYLGTAIQGTITEATGYADQFSNAGIDLAAALSNGMATAEVSGGSDVAKNMLDAVNDYKDDFNTAGRNFALGLANGVAFRAYSAVRAAETVAIQMINATRRIFNERSPSKVAQQIGSYFTEGLAIGTSDKASEATNAASEVADSMLATASGTLSNLSSLLAEDIDVNPVIAPVVDLTNARQSAALIGGLFGNPSMTVTSSVLASNAMQSTNNGRPITIQNGTMSTSESFDGVTDKLNSLTEYLTARNDGPKLDEMTYLSEKFGDLAEAVTNLKIVLDTGTLVGELTPALDTGFGTLASRRDRGN